MVCALRTQVFTLNKHARTSICALMRFRTVLDVVWSVNRKSITTCTSPPLCGQFCLCSSFFVVYAMVVAIRAATAPASSVIESALTAPAPLVLRHSCGSGSANCLHSAPRKFVRARAWAALSYCCSQRRKWCVLVSVIHMSVWGGSAHQCEHRANSWCPSASCSRAFTE